MRLTILLNLFLICCQSVTAQDSTNVTTADDYFSQNQVIKKDSTQLTQRFFDADILQDLRDSEEFNYRQPPSVAESVWDRFLSWLDQLFGWILRSAVKTDWGQVMLYTVGLVLLIAIVMMLLKVDALRVFYSGADQGPMQYQSFEENIHEMDFDQLIREALQKKEYRNAVRLTFLNSLKLLSDRQHVDWRPGKTNHEYLEELKETELKTGFNELSFYFDYAWYGDFNVNENLYQRVQVIFNDWKKKVG